MGKGYIQNFPCDTVPLWGLGGGRGGEHMHIKNCMFMDLYYEKNRMQQLINQSRIPTKEGDIKTQEAKKGREHIK